MDIEQCLSWAPIQEYGCPENIERLRRAEHLADEKGVSVPTVAHAWALKQPLNLFCILGPSSPSHLDSLLRAFEVELTDHEADWLNLCDE